MRVERYFHFHKLKVEEKMRGGGDGARGGNLVLVPLGTRSKNYLGVVGPPKSRAATIQADKRRLAI